MSEWCKEHSIKMFGFNENKELCKDEEMTTMLCEGCGKSIWVNHEGEKIETEPCVVCGDETTGKSGDTPVCSVECLGG